MLDVLGCVVKKERMYEMGCWHVVKVKVHTYIMIMMMSTFFTAFRSGINQHLLFGLSEWVSELIKCTHSQYLLLVLISGCERIVFVKNEKKTVLRRNEL